MAEKKREFMWAERNSRTRSATLWMAPRLEKRVRALPGVAALGVTPGFPCKFTVYFDPRYNHETVKIEIEALLEAENGKRADPEGLN